MLDQMCVLISVFTKLANFLAPKKIILCICHLKIDIVYLDEFLKVIFFQDIYSNRILN